MKLNISTFLFLVSSLIAPSICHQIRSTNQERTWILIFDQNDALFPSISGFEQTAALSIIHQGIVRNQVPFSASFLSQSGNLLKLTIDSNEDIEVESTVQLQFADPQTSTLIHRLVFPSLASSSFSNQDQKKLNALTKLDRALEYAWIAVSCLEPSGFLYMSTKLYRETLELFKKTNVQYGALMTEYFRTNSNKNSGFKAPNMFSILIQDNQLTSGWNRKEENELPFDGINSERIGDLAIPSSYDVTNYDAFPLFMDNYGIQITVFLAILVLIIIFEMINWLLKNRSGSRVQLFFKKVSKFLRWNLLIACIIGSFQSLLFFLMVQIQSFIFEKQEDGSVSSHTKINFWFAIGTAIVLLLLFPLWLIQRTISRWQKSSPSYRFIFKVFKSERKAPLLFMLVLLFRATGFAALTLFLKKNPIAQISTLVGLSLLCMITLCVLRPFKRAFYFVFQICNETVLVFYLSTLLYLVYQVEHNTLESNEINITSNVLVAFWLLVPTLAIVFGAYNIVSILVSAKKPKPELPVSNNNLVPAETEQQALGDAKVFSDLFKVSSDEEGSDDETCAKTLNNDLNGENRFTREENVSVLTIKSTEEPQVMQRRIPLSLSNIEAIIEDAANEQGSADPQKKLGSKGEENEVSVLTIKMNQEPTRFPQSGLSAKSELRSARPRNKIFGPQQSAQASEVRRKSIQQTNVDITGNDLERVQDRTKSQPIKLSLGREPVETQRNQNVPETSTRRRKKIFEIEPLRVKQEGFRISKERYQLNDN